MKVQEISLADRILRYAQGPGSGAPLVLIGGIGMALESMEKPAQAFADLGLCCLSLALPRSPAKKLWRLHDYADLLAQWLDYLQIEQLPVMGVSWGGALAQEFARRHPQRVSQLVLVSTSAGLFMLPGTPKALASFLRPRLYRTPRAESKSDRIHVNAVQVGWQMLAATGWTSIHWLHRLEQPALVISGKRDNLTRPVNARLLAARLPNAQLEMIENAGHMCAYSRAPDVAKLVKSFLDSTGVADGEQTTQ